MDQERYEIIKLLGKGRTGGVYEAEDTNLGRKVALRRFFAQGDDIDVDVYKDEFTEVAQELSVLQHPNLLRVYDAGVDGDGAYIISQLLQGETLNDKIKNEGPMPAWEVYDMAQQMLDALTTAHEEGYVHGAITPGSILLSPRARGGYLYVILDMGLSRLAPLIQGKDSFLAMMADPAILAPELFDGGVATERGDLYMLGHILFMSLAGGHPFGGVSTKVAQTMHGVGLPPLEQYVQGVPEDLRLWIEHLVQFNPDKRPTSAVEALSTLPKVPRPARNSATAVHNVTPQLTPGTAPQPQSPAGANPGLDPRLTTGVVATSPNTLTAGVGVLSLPPAKTDYKKLIFIWLGLLVLILAIWVTLVFRNINAEKQQLASKPAKTVSDEEVEHPEVVPPKPARPDTGPAKVENNKPNKPVRKEIAYPVAKPSTLLVDFNFAGKSETQANYIGVDRNSTSIKTNLAASGSSISLSFNFYDTEEINRDRDRKKLEANQSHSDLLRDFIFGAISSKKGDSGLTITLGPIAAGNYTFTGFHHDSNSFHKTGTIRINGGKASTFTNSISKHPDTPEMSKVNFTSNGVSDVVIFLSNPSQPAIINGFAIEPVP